MRHTISDAASSINAARYLQSKADSNLWRARRGKFKELEGTRSHSANRKSYRFESYLGKQERSVRAALRTKEKAKAAC